MISVPARLSLPLSVLDFRDMTRAEIIEKIANSAGLDRAVVDTVLNSLAEAAYCNQSDNFLLPGFGTIQIVDGAPIRKPGTGEMVARPRCNVEFRFDTLAKERILSTDNQLAGENSPNAKRKLPQIKLEPNTSDLAVAGIEFLENLKTKLGGDPDWVQCPDAPTCCGVEMTFYAQIDSNINNEFNIADGGMLYVFCCDHCSNSSSKMQCY